MKLSKIIRLRIGNRLLAIKVFAWNTQVHNHTGITNQTPDGMLVPFWDFQEGTSLGEIIGTLRDVQQEWGLSTIYILQTNPKESYRAFCLDKVDFQEAIAILSSTSYIDINYLRSLAMRKLNVIRVTEKEGTKNKIVEVLDTWNNNLRKQSSHHGLFFGKLYGHVTINEYPESRLQVKLSRYETLR